jgi:hypothetical protein
MSPVQWQKLELPLGLGIETKTDDAVSLNGELASLQNAVFTTGGTLRRRNGYARVGGASLTNPKALATFNGELLGIANGQLQTLTQNQTAWTARGACRSVAMTSQMLAQGPTYYSQPDAAYANGFTVYAWVSSQDRLAHAMVIEQATGAVVLADTALSTYQIATNLQAFSCGNTLYVAYYNGTNLVWRSLDTTSATPSWTTETAIVSAKVFRFVNLGAQFALFYWTGVNPVRGCNVSTAGAVSNDTAHTGMNYTGTGAFSCVLFAANRLISICESASGDLKGKITSALWVTASVVFGIDSLSSVTIARATACASGSNVMVFWDVVPTGGATHTRYLKTAVFTGTGSTVTSAAVLFRSVSLASDAFVQDSAPHVWVKYYSNALTTNSSATQSYIANSGLFLVTGSGGIVSRALSSQGLLAGDPSGFNQVASLATLATGTYLAAFPALGPYDINQQGIGFQTPGLASVEFDFSAERPRSVQLGQNLLVAGGCPTTYDGQNAVEQGFPIFPEQPAYSSTVTAPATWASSTAKSVGALLYGGNGFIYAATVGGATGLVAPTWPTAPGATVVDGGVTWRCAGNWSTSNGLGAGTYSYQVIYEWLDSKGQLHQSAPSPALSVTLGAGTTHAAVALSLVTLRMTRKSGVRIAVYRTQADTTSLQRCGYMPNDTTADSVIFVDDLTDDVLESQPFINAGLVYEAAPPSTMCSQNQNRCFLAGLEDPYTVAPSLLGAAQYGWAWSSGLRFQVDPAFGPVTGLATLDDKTIVFQKYRPNVILGEGPDNTGSGTPFTVQPIASDVGCINADSIVATANGILFLSAKGWYLLGRDLSVQYAGSQVEAFNGQTYTAATVVPGATQIRLLASSGSTLMADYFVKSEQGVSWQWGTFTNHTGLDAVVWNGWYVYLDGSGNVLVESGYRDFDGTVPAVSFKTVNIKFDGLQGFARVSGIRFMLDGSDTYKFNVSVAPNNTASFTALSPVVSSNAAGLPMFECSLPPQLAKVASLQVLVSEDVSAVTSGAGAAFISMAFEVGIKGRLYRLPSTNKG